MTEVTGLENRVFATEVSSEDSVPNLSGLELSAGALALIELEQSVGVRITEDKSLRPKILDSCGMACNFCHNEGTPVAAAYVKDITVPNTSYRGERVSVFEKTNGVNFLPGAMRPDDAFGAALDQVKSLVAVEELHITGGEPTLHTDLPGLISFARQRGFRVKMTSNGEGGMKRMSEYAAAGLEKINFSIFGTTAEELASIQSEKFSSVALADLKLRLLHQAIGAALAHEIAVDANIVMSDESHESRVAHIIDTYDSRVTVRLLNDLDAGSESYIAIYNMLAKIGAVPTEVQMHAGSSNSRVKYVLPDGRSLYFKQIRRTVLPDSCDDCELNNDQDCKEGYYGLRLYIDTNGEYKIGICIQRMDMTMGVEEFRHSGLPDEIAQLRKKELAALTLKYHDRLL